MREVLGAPIVPPGRVARAMMRARAALLGAHRGSGPPLIRVLEALFGIFDNRVLGLLVELGVTEALDGPHTVAELAAATGTDEDGLGRVLRYAAGRGFVGVDRSGRYRPNGVTRLLRRDHVSSWRGWAEFLGSDWVWDAVRHVDATLRPGGPSGFEAALGHPFFEYVNHVRPEAGRAFNAAMQAGSTAQALALAHALDWSRTRTVCDVGGGTGAAIEALLGFAPELTATLYDLPEVVADARPALRSGPLADRCTIVGGDFFESVPAGCDRYLLLAIVHDWDDEHAIRILRNVRDAMGPDSRAAVVDSVLSDEPRDELAAATDFLMLALVSGRERTAAEFDALFRAAGLVLEGRAPLASGFTALELRRG